jgi:RNA polymerase sigma-70 factor (ECF subfamily)
MQNRHKGQYLEDDALAAMAQEGNTRAFEYLLDRHYQSSLKLAASILRDRDTAEDEVQNAWWKAFEHIAQFQHDAKFSTWLTRIVVNQCLMRLRQQRRSWLVYIEDTAFSDDSRTVDFPSPALSPEAAVAKSEVYEVLEKEINRIPPLLRHVFLLRDVYELPMPDVAERLGISVAATKSRLLRARLELRERLRKYEGRLGPANLLA